VNREGVTISRFFTLHSSCPFRALEFGGRIERVKIQSTIGLRFLLSCALLSLGLFTSRARALEPDQIALIVNSNVPEGVELAKFYAAQRHLPDNRILALDLPKTEHMTRRQYEDEVVPKVRDFLHSNQLDEKVTCLVTFYGVPLAIDARVNTPEEADESTDLTRQLQKLPLQIEPAVIAVEAMAQKLNPSFVPEKLADLDHLIHREGVAFHEISSQLASIPDPARQAQLDEQFCETAASLLGDVGKITILQIAPAAHPSTKPFDPKPLEDAEKQFVSIKREASELETQPNSAKARQRLRQIVSEHFGSLQYANLLRGQVDFLATDESGAAFDNELAMVHWLAYVHKRFIANPLWHGGTASSPFRTLMVCRLDAPQAETVKSMISTSIKVEQQGLTGQVVIDSQGLKSGDKNPDQIGFSAFDQNLRNLAKLLTDHTKLKVTLDEKPAVLPAGSEDDVALYVGWYSLRNYIPCCKFNPGAVGYHVASYELVSLHQPGEPGWVHGLINDGVVATLGAVAEPYLSSFPRPDEFFPLLLTGRLTVGEVYWKTNPMVSWMQCFIGDPLYNPYKQNPAISDLDLPLQLREVLENQSPAR
jgi:uncharacterized protein (TIGR03790 family)